MRSRSSILIKISRRSEYCQQMIERVTYGARLTNSRISYGDKETLCHYEDHCHPTLSYLGKK